MRYTTNGPRRRASSGRLTLALLLCLAALGCGSLTAGGFGEATVVMSGDAPDQSPQATDNRTAPQPAIVATSAPAGTTAGGDSAGQASAIDPLLTDHGDGDPDGWIEVDLTVFLVALDGGLVPVTDDAVEVRVDLDGMEEPEIASRRVTATTYTDLRLVFTDIQVEVEDGLIIDGQPVTGTIDVELDDLTLTVTKAIDLEIAEGESVELLIDLNAASWLQAVDPVMLTVDAEVFADLVAVIVR